MGQTFNANDKMALEKVVIFSFDVIGTAFNDSREPTPNSSDGYVHSRILR